MRSGKSLLMAALALLAFGCAGEGWQNNEWFLHRKGVAVEGPDKFQVCQGYGCARISSVSLSSAEWQAVRARFAAPAPSAEAERRLIAAAVADLERSVGPKVGTERDRGGTFIAGGGIGQLDCVDETVNTTVFLTLLQRDGLLSFHETRGPAGRGTFLGDWPHQSAVVTETATGREFAIDSWFHDSGETAEVVPLEAWLDGWSPPGFKDRLL